MLFANLDGLDTGRFNPQNANSQAAIPCGGKTPRRVTIARPGDPAPAETAFSVHRPNGTKA